MLLFWYLVMINPTDADKGRRVVLRNDEDRGVMLNYGYGNFGSGITDRAYVQYDSDGGEFFSKYSDLTWEEDWKAH